MKGTHTNNIAFTPYVLKYISHHHAISSLDISRINFITGFPVLIRRYFRWDDQLGSIY